MCLNRQAATIVPVAGLLCILLAGTALTLSGCISVPPTNAAMSMRDNTLTVGAPLTCDDGMPSVDVGAPERGGLDPDGFSVMVWNGMKNGGEAWAQDFLGHSRGSDLVIMQEAYLTENLRKTLRTGGYLWDMSVAFRYRERASGVLTASTVDPNFLCAERNTEPVLRTPKTFLVTRYPLSGTERNLLVVNIHSINVTFDTEEFLAQLMQLTPVLSTHQGPVVLAGDFNTWSAERGVLVEDLVSSLGLREVAFPEDNRVTFFGNHVDHVYYRGLDYGEAEVSPVATSDHNPMTVTFRLPEEHYAAR